MRVLLLAALLAQLMATAGPAQTYSPSTPVPRTTSVPALRAFASAREVEERFKIGLDAESRGDWKAAVAEFDRIVATEPARAERLDRRTTISRSPMRTCNATTMPRARCAPRSHLDPGFLAAMANLIAVDLARGDLREARTHRRSLRRARSRFGARALLARYRRASGRRRDDGARRFRQAAASQSVLCRRALRSRTRGRAAGPVRSGRTRAAQRAALAPAYARARFALGVVLLREGEHARGAQRLCTRDARRVGRSGPEEHRRGDARFDQGPLGSSGLDAPLHFSYPPPVG